MAVFRYMGYIRKYCNLLILRNNLKILLNFFVTFDLFYYITHCLYLHRDRGCYIIALENTTPVRGSRTLVKDLVRLLEYGNEVLPPYPLIREILSYYQQNWEEEFANVIEKVLGE